MEIALFHAERRRGFRRRRPQHRPVDPIAVADQRVVPEVPGLAQRMRAPAAEDIKEVVSEGPEAIAIILLLGGFSS
ncbi:hypothetical protein BQ8794_50523 [Mesorhizobium prunaredense]|uniref:Uncharacterized protein n=1 Tax=Mesorhizobium prunaredense TaxID=1631249 RepID=A0A1R3VHT6_9HYPH|nr:hypothetical protein BQ8794_50523 [Mesorhizobium prunaredense]